MNIYISIAVLVAVVLFFMMIEKATKTNEDIQLFKFLIGAVCLGACWPIFVVVIIFELLSRKPS